MAVVLELNYSIPSVGTMCTGFFVLFFSGDQTSVTYFNRELLQCTGLHFFY